MLEQRHNHSLVLHRNQRSCGDGISHQTCACDRNRMLEQQIRNHSLERCTSEQHCNHSLVQHRIRMMELHRSHSHDCDDGTSHRTCVCVRNHKLVQRIGNHNQEQHKQAPRRSPNLKLVRTLELLLHIRKMELGCNLCGRKFQRLHWRSLKRLTKWQQWPKQNDASRKPLS